MDDEAYILALTIRMELIALANPRLDTRPVRKNAG